MRADRAFVARFRSSGCGGRSGGPIRRAAGVMRPRAGGTPSHSPLKAARFLIRAFLALGVALSRPSSQFKTTEVREVQG